MEMITRGMRMQFMNVPRKTTLAKQIFSMQYTKYFAYNTSLACHTF
jgi:hypothetical protein